MSPIGVQPILRISLRSLLRTYEHCWLTTEGDGYLAARFENHSSPPIPYLSRAQLAHITESRHRLALACMSTIRKTHKLPIPHNFKDLYINDSYPAPTSSLHRASEKPRLLLTVCQIVLEW